MMREPHDDRDSMKVWLDESEVVQLLERAEDSTHRLALALGARSGLRSAEVVDVAPVDVVDGPAGTMLRVPDGKGGKYRETPVPDDVATRIETIADVRDVDQDAPLVDVTTRTLRRWVTRYGAVLADETDDVGWRDLSYHDLRRTWATLLANESEVDPLVVCRWGGWADLETFLDHYRGAHSPAVQRRERSKVDWL